MTPMQTATPVAPPEGYPEPDFTDDGTFRVAPELREWYVSAAESGVGSREDWGSVRDKGLTATVPDETGKMQMQQPVDYPLWAHLVRRDRARQLLAAHRQQVQREAAKRPCVVCGTRLDAMYLKAIPNPLGTAYACQDDVGPLKAELHARAMLPMGVTRQQAVMAAADRLLAAIS